ncbi:MAG: DUF4003 family protein [Firmicutes bacterium]|nr:DUF4003 family protein [Bacillota bacterium]
MSSKVIENCCLLADNRDILHKKFMWEGDIMISAASMIFTEAGRKADVDRMKACRKILQKKKGLFSEFRGIAEMIVISRMALMEDPEAYLDQLSALYDQLHEGKLLGSEYMVLSAICISDLYAGEEAAATVQKVRSLMKKMKELHPFLTSSEDMAYVSLMALSPKTETILIEEAESAYQQLKDHFTFHKNAVQSLGMVLAALPGSAAAKCDKVLEIFNALKEQKIRYGKEEELPSLGILSDLNLPTGQLVEEIKEAESYLRERKGFGALTIGKTARIMFAALMTAKAYQENTSMNVIGTAAVSSSISTMIAIQTAMLVMMTTSSAASSAATNN